ncbi:MAG: DUF5050 domain-containing protein [Clostridia bacterium]|nr:DUF5050 domain-containing protein [Clostridia bacterium]
MKKFFIILSALLLLTGASALADGNPEIYLDGEKLYTESEPVNIDERVLVPMRAVFEALGADVTWDGDAQTVWASREGEFICLELSSGTMSTGVHNSDGQPYWVSTEKLDVPARLIGDYTYVPVRAISETLSACVSWDGDNNRVVIDSRKDVPGIIYYASDSDFQYLYCVGKNGLGRRMISKRQVKSLEMYDGYVYYVDKNNGYLYRADYINGEELLLDRTVYKVKVDDGFVYYQELDGGGPKSGILFRINVETKEIEQLTDGHVKYAEMYRDYIYYNIDGQNVMYALLKDGSQLYTVDTGDSVFSKLYPFNCIFYGDYILIEDGVWFGNLMRCDLNGENMIPLTRLNAFVEKNQEHNEWIIYKQPDHGQDIYCIGIDGSDNHLIHESPPSWLDITLLAQYNDMVYYKHPMRNEVYRVNLDGSNDIYVGYAYDIQVHDDRLFLSWNGLYMGNLDGSDMKKLFGRTLKGFAIINENIYFKDELTTRLCMADYNGRNGMITVDACGEWAESDY